jgi:ribosome-associated protein
MANQIAAMAADRKALEIVQLDLREMIGYTDYFVICNGLLPRRVEGLPEAHWILMDYLDVVVHVFTPDTREYYRLEQLWGEAPVQALTA